MGGLYHYITAYIGIYLRDIFSFLLIVAGGYLTFVLGATAWWARPLRFLGACLIVLGAANWLIAYGDKQATDRCQANERVATLQDQVKQLTRERDAATLASEKAAEARKKLEEMANDQQQQLDQWAAFASTLKIGGRAATADDDRRLCNILGNAPTGCAAPPEAVRRER